MTITVGQELWFVYSDHYHRRGKDEVAKVTKVGRKWAELSNGYRVDLHTLIAEGAGYSSAGRAHVSRAHWEEEKRRKGAWEALRGRLREAWGGPPRGISTENIRAAAALLGIGLGEKP
jgi:hypothetical protein